MKKTQQQQQYKYEEFDEHVSLYNCIPAGAGHSLVLLRKIIEGIQSGNFNRNPSLIIVGENAREMAVATANALCSPDIREIDSKLLFTTKNQMDFFSDSSYEVVHIICNVSKIGLSESVLWQFIKNREYKFQMMDRSVQSIFCHGLIILTADEVKSIPSTLIQAVDFKATQEQFTQDQLELLVHQRLKFCGIDYLDDGKLLKLIVELGHSKLYLINYLLKICILLAQTEHNNNLSLRTVQRASKLV